MPHTPTTPTTHDHDAEFLEFFHGLGVFGETPHGGVDRQAGSAADAEQRTWFATWLTEHGFTIAHDDIGNLFGRIEWVPGAPYVLAGSHLDSQPLGGKFDGAYGVIAAAHAAHRLNKAFRNGTFHPIHNIAVVDWFNEEGSRFEPSMMGSSVHTGKLDLETALTTKDKNGTSVQEALTSLLDAGAETTQLPPISAYAEIHVEQGRTLENDGTTIGIVTSTWAARKFNVIVTGEQSHTGSTIMPDRKDALLGAARLVVAVRELADTHQNDQLHTSVARFDVRPNSPVVVAREVEMNIDLRCANQNVLDKAERNLRNTITSLAIELGLTISLEITHSWDRQPYPADGIDLARAIATREQFPHQDIMTIAGHDSTNMKDTVPTVMLFVPSVDGIAHNEGELTSDADLTAGVGMLTHVLNDLCITLPSP